MPTIEITLHRDYCPEWKLFEGLREIIQNAKDGETEFNSRMEVQYRPGSRTLVVMNHGVVIPKEALLIGFSTKRDKKDLIGQFGEGLNLGLLALVRNGLKVVVRSGNEVWKPVIEHSNRFDADVLKIKTSTASVMKHRTSVEISPINSEEWEEFKKLFLFLAEKDDKRLEDHLVITTERGRVLLHPEMRGMIFIKGIFIEKRNEIAKGYDLKHFKTDRDRKMIDTWDLKWATSRMWAEALTKQWVSPNVIYEMLEQATEDTDQLSYGIGADDAERILEIFHDRYGENAIPVDNMAQSKEVEHFGKKGVVISQSLRKALEVRLGDYETQKRELTTQTLDFISWSDLSQEERNNLSLSVDMIEGILGEDIKLLSRINVAVFVDSCVEGLYHSGKITLNRKILENQAKTLATLTHETLHSIGEDGSHDFHHSVETLLASIAVAAHKKAN